MAKRAVDRQFEIGFFESILRRDPGYVSVIEVLGGLYTEVGRIAEGLKMDRKLVRLRPTDATAHYNLACSLALSKRPKQALLSLRRAIALGYDDPAWMAKDPDLKSLHASPDFQSLLQSFPPEAF